MYTSSTIEETARKLSGNLERGLTREESARRLRQYGRNEMKSVRRKTVAERFLAQLNDPLIYVLIGAAAISLSLKEISDAVIIAVVVCVNATVGLIQEGKAQKALDSLKKLTSPRALVIRDGEEREIPAAELVPGDLVCLETGCQVPADLRLVKSVRLKVEESSLTGESLPMEKDAGFLGTKGAELSLGDRRNMVYMSTIVTSGRGMGLVTATGMDTELGKIAELISGGREELTPLQKRLGELGTVLSILSLGLCGILFVIALIQHRNVPDMLITAISLAVAAVPEGLPAVVTICLALSVTRMVRVNTIVRRLPSVETLGAVSVVCSDKTGTLTQNRMTVEKCYLDLREREVGTEEAGKRGDGVSGRGYGVSGDGEFVRRYQEFFRGMVLCNDAGRGVHHRIGDPTELALLDLGACYGVEKEALEKRFPRRGELAFDSDRKMMTTCHSGEGNGGYVTYTKGAPERVLECCDRILLQGQILPMTETERERILTEGKRLSGEALRTLALAMGRGQEPCPREERLIFLGLVAMKDPPRPEAAEAVETFRRAGVDTVMITGDHVDTAYAIGRKLRIVTSPEECMTGSELERLPKEAFYRRLDQVRVFARVSPAQKVEIVKGFQQRGKIVAMTGDGVNDAPSLKAADIGIAMGLAGTDVAKQASDMILTDDNFATIEKAIEEGRGVYENIRKSVIFLLSSNMGELMTMFVAVLCGIASPLKSSHILWINLITDSLPALALGVDRNDGKSLMNHPPRGPKESMFARGGLLCTCFYGILIALISLTAFLMLPLAVLRLEGAVPAPGMAGGLAWLCGPGNLRTFFAELRDVLLRPDVLTKSQTYAFTVLGMSQLFHAIGMRDVHRSVFCMNHWENKLMLFAVGFGFCLQFAVTEIPFLIKAFGTAHLAGEEWLWLCVLAAFPMLAHEVLVCWRLTEKKGRGRLFLFQKMPFDRRGRMGSIGEENGSEELRIRKYHVGKL